MSSMAKLKTLHHLAQIIALWLCITIASSVFIKDFAPAPKQENSGSINVLEKKTFIWNFRLNLSSSHVVKIKKNSLHFVRRESPSIYYVAHENDSLQQIVSSGFDGMMSSSISKDVMNLKLNTFL